MKNLTIKQVAFFSVLFFGWAVVAGAGTINCNVTTQSQNDALTLAVSETLTTNVANVSGIGEVNEIDVFLTSIGGTYSNGADVIPSTSGMNGVVGTWTALGGSLYLPASRGNPTLSETVNGAGGYTSTNTNGTPPQIAGAGNAAFSEINFDTIGPAPSLGAAAAAVQPSSNSWYAATNLTGGWYTTFQNLILSNPDPTPGGTWGLTGAGGVPTGSGFNNTLIAAFYVSPSTTGMEFYTTDGNAFGNSNYGQFQFNYGGGRTDYVQVMPVPTPEPATLVLLGTALVGLLAYAWRKRR